MASYDYRLVTPVEIAGAPSDFSPRDPILAARTGFFRFLVDDAFPWSYPGGDDPTVRPAAGAPADGAVVRDLTGFGDAHFRKASGQTVTYAGGGFDLHSVTGRGEFLEIPASVNADLYAPAPAGSDHVGESQAWAECNYIIFPAASGWTGVTGGSIPPIIHSTDSPYYGSSTAKERVWIALDTGGTLYAVFQQSSGSVANTNYVQLVIGSTSANPHRGLLTQILAYRKRDGTIGVRLKSSAGTTPATGSATANAADYSALTGKVGVTANTTWPASGMSLAASPFRIFRHWIGNLSRQELDPVALADEDYGNVVARAVYSAT